VCIRVLEFSGEVPAARELTYAALAGRSAAVAARLRGRGLGPGERVAIMLPTGPEFFTSFMGTLMAGGVAVPVYPPSSRARLEEQLRRQAAIVGNAGAATLITVGEAGLVARLLRSRLPSLRLVASEPELRTGAGGGGGLSAVAAGDLAMLRTPRAALVTPRG
jgi:acyl-CoA synthetase (AMP-forming)/AMP-acid ligase II